MILQSEIELLINKKMNRNLINNKNHPIIIKIIKRFKKKM